MSEADRLLASAKSDVGARIVEAIFAQHLAAGASVGQAASDTIWALAEFAPAIERLAQAGALATLGARAGLKESASDLATLAQDPRVFEPQTLYGPAPGR